MRCTCRRCGVTGLRQASLRPHCRRRDPVQIKFAGVPPRSPDSTPVCAISLSSSLDVGSPRSPSGIPVVARPGQSSPQLSTVRIRRNQSWPLPRRRHARHRLDEGVRQSRPGHPGVGRFGYDFPGGARTGRSELLPPRSRDGPPGIRSAGRQPPRTEFHAFSLARRRVDPSVPRILWVLRLFSPAGDGTGRGFSYFILPDGTGSLNTGTRRSWLSFTTFTHWSGTSGSRRSASGPQRYLATGTTTLRRGLLSHCRSPACVVYRPGAAGLWPPRHPHPHPPPRGSGVRTELESRPDCRDRSNVTSPPSGRTQACHAHLATAENGSPETRLKQDLGLVSEGHLTGVGRPV